MSWRATLLSSVKRNASLPNAKYLQLSTVRPNGRPANRTVVFRGFLGESEDPTFVTDVRSQKVGEVAQCPFAEACWYFPITREQFRLSGKLQIVSSETSDSGMQEARVNAWRKMSPAGRSQFAWPEPGIPRLEGDAPLDDGLDPALIADESLPLPAFCLVVLTVDEVDHLLLKANRRYHHKRLDAGGWEMAELNP